MESIIQNRIKTFLEKQGWYVVKCITMSKNGFPDLLCFRNGLSLLVEVKRKGEKARALQEYRIKELKLFGVNAHCVDSIEQLKEISGVKII